MTRNTSIAVYYKIEAEGLLSKRRMQVYKSLFYYGPMSQNETYVQLDVPKLQQSSIMPRFAELKEMGVIEEVGERPCSITGRKVLIWDVTANLPVDREKKLTFSVRKNNLSKKVITVCENNPSLRKELLEIYYDLQKL